MKRSKELSNEVIRIIKSMTQSDEPTQLDKIVMEFDKKTAPEHVKVIFDENVERIQEIDKNNMEFNVILQYLTWISHLPFGLRSQEDFDLEKAERILEEDH